MDKTELLKTAADKFRQELMDADAEDPEVLAMLKGVEPLFARIASGEVTPPAAGVYQVHLHSEHPRYGSGTRLFSAESSFVSALEDWRSKSWYPT